MSLFEVEASEHEPLATRMRPRTVAEVLGQEQLLRPGAPLRRLIEGETDSSVILWGPPGSGKTTLALLIAEAAGRRFHPLSAVDAGVKDVREAVAAAKLARELHGVGTVLFIDEVHRFSKAQQDALLGPVEQGAVTLVGATTENPFFSVIAPLMSRCLLLTVQPLADDDVRALIARAVADPRGLPGRTVTREAVEHLVRLAGGDARRALTLLEAAAVGGEVTVAAVAAAADRAALRYDRAGDEHYDVASALIKSIRGGDVDAALHYLARMLEAGEDPRFVARRLVILASEDIGLADPTALPTAVAAAQALELIGLPEARLNLAHATIHLALAPKSNAVIRAIDAATADIRDGRVGPVPQHLRRGGDYRYPHDFPEGVVAQQYAPDDVAGREYYRASDHGAEAAAGRRLAELRAALRRMD